MVSLSLSLAAAVTQTLFKSIIYGEEVFKGPLPEKHKSMYPILSFKPVLAVPNGSTLRSATVPVQSILIVIFYAVV